MIAYRGSDFTWTFDRDDPRVAAGLERRCGICGVDPGVHCTSLNPDRSPLETGIVHLARVPKRALFRKENPAL